MSTLVHNHNDANVESIRFPIKDLNKFYETDNGQFFVCKPVTLNNMNLQIYIYPNGQNEEQLGYVQFMLVVNRFPSNIKSAAIYCCLYCTKLHTLFKTVSILTSNKQNNYIGWPIHQLSLSELSSYHNLSHLDFQCDILLLNVKYKRNSISDGLKKLKKSKKNIASLINNDNDIFNPTAFSFKSQTNFEWKINAKSIKLFKNAPNGKFYDSMNINNIWCLSVSPNGDSQRHIGQFMLSLKLLRLPSRIKSIEVNFTFQRKQKQNGHNIVCQRYNVLFNYQNNEQSIRVFKTSALESMIPLIFVVTIKIIKIYEDTGRNTKGKEIKNDCWYKLGMDDNKMAQTEMGVGIDDGSNYNVDLNGTKSSPNSKHFQFSETWTGSTPDVTNNVVEETEDDEKNTLRRQKSLRSYRVIINDVSRPNRSSYISSSKRPSLATNISLTPYNASTLMSPPFALYGSSTSSYNSSTSNYPNKNKKQSHQRSKTTNDLQNRECDNEILQFWDKKELSSSDINIEQQQYSKMQQLNLKKGKSADSNTLESVVYDHSDHEEMKGFKIMDDALNTDHGENDRKIKIDNIHCQRFQVWLSEDVALDQYLYNFKKAAWSDIRMVKYFTDSALESIGIINQCHRRLILEEVEIFKKLQCEFNQFVDKHKTLRSFKRILKQNAILTRNDLENIENKEELQKIFKLLPNDDRISEIWNIIHPSQSRLKTEMIQLQQQQTLMVNTFNNIQSYIQSVRSMQNILSNASVSKPNDTENISIQQQQDSILNDLISRLKNNLNDAQQMKPKNIYSHRGHSNQPSWSPMPGSETSSSSNRKLMKGLVDKTQFANPSQIQRTLSNDTVINTDHITSSDENINENINDNSISSALFDHHGSQSALSFQLNKQINDKNNKQQIDIKRNNNNGNYNNDTSVISMFDDRILENNKPN